MNDDHADWVLAVGQGFADLPDAERAVAVDLDRDGVGIDVVAAGTTHRVRVPFPEPASNEQQLQTFALELAREARRRAGETSFEKQATDPAASPGGLDDRILATRLIQYAHLRTREVMWTTS